jgi:hypothetical protein
MLRWWLDLVGERAEAAERAKQVRTRDYQTGEFYPISAMPARL